MALPLWQHLSLARLELEMKQAPHLEKKWRAMLKKQKKDGVDKSKGLFLPLLIDTLFARIAAVPVQVCCCTCYCCKGRARIVRFSHRVAAASAHRCLSLPPRPNVLALLNPLSPGLACR